MAIEEHKNKKESRPRITWLPIVNPFANKKSRSNSEMMNVTTLKVSKSTKINLERKSDSVLTFLFVIADLFKMKKF